MTELVDSSTRGPIDYIQFAATFFGVLVTAGGVILTSPALAGLGLLLAGFGLAYFLVREWLERQA